MVSIEESYDQLEIVFGDDEIKKHKDSGKVLSLRCIESEAEENALALEGYEFEMNG